MTETKDTPSAVVYLHEVVECMDIPSEEWTAYINRRTGELVDVSHEDLRLAEADEEPQELPDWQDEEVSKAREVLGSEDFLARPDKFEIHEYSIIERFCLEVEDPGVRETLLRAIRGADAFRRFKEAIHERHMADAWYAYRQQALEEIAAEWLEDHGIAFSREKRPPDDTAG
jgi:hypothetical protein